MYRKFFVLISICVIAVTVSAQERVDSVGVTVAAGLTETDIDELTRPIGQGQEGTVEFVPQPLGSDINTIEVQSDLERRQMQVSPAWNGMTMPKGSTLPRWAAGYVYGYNRWDQSLMYGYVATSGFGVQQKLGQYWRVSAGMELQKYSINYNTASFDGSLTWQPNRNFAITAFGTYMPGSFLSPISIGESFQWGGYVTLQSNGALGIDIGARQTYDAFVGHEVLPIVKPYVKVGGAKLGIDLGPAIKSAVEGKRHGSNGVSSIPRPQKVLPAVGPRR